MPAILIIQHSLFSQLWQGKNDERSSTRSSLEMKEKATVMSNGGGNGENTDEQTLSRANNCCILIPRGEVPCLWGHNTTPKNRPLCLCTPFLSLHPLFAPCGFCLVPDSPPPSVVAWPGNSKQEMVCLSDFSFANALFVRLVPEDLPNTAQIKLVWIRILG